MEKNMLFRLKAGLLTAKRHPWMISMLFLYQLTWGFVLYKVIQTFVMPLLYRFPVDYSDFAVQVFLAEGQFQLLKTNVLQLPLSLLAAIALARIIITPLLNAGIYYSIARDEVKQIRPFMIGVRKLSLPFIGIYCAQFICAVLPLYWLVTTIVKIVSSRTTIDEMFIAALPLLLGYWAYINVLKLCFMYVQFGKTNGTTMLRAQLVFWRNIGPVILLSFVLFAITCILALLNLSLTMIWASLLSIILHQLYYLSKSFMSIWEISAQYNIWKEQVGDPIQAFDK